MTNNHHNCEIVLQYFFLALLVVSLQGCLSSSTFYNSQLAQIEPDDPPLIVHAKELLGRRYYEVRYLNIPVGRTTVQKWIALVDGIPVYRMQRSDDLQLQVYGTTNAIKTVTNKTFSISPPYHLLSYSYEKQSGKKKQSFTVNRNETGMYSYVTISTNRQPQQGEVRLPYTLKDELELVMWVQSLPREHTRKALLQVGMMVPEIERIDATLQNIRTDNTDGLTRNIYEIAVSDGYHLRERRDFDENGQLLYMIDSDKFHYYFRENKAAVAPVELIDLYVRSMVPIDQKIGKVDQIKRLHLNIMGPNSELLVSAPGQLVTHEELNGSSHVILGFKDEDTVGSKISQADIARYSKKNFGIGLYSKDILTMAREAVGDAIQREDRVTRLAHFVDGYLSNEYTFETDLVDVIKERKGDCTEHALLFEALARSLDIPCRMVFGLVYQGDWCRGFGLHAWNEVVIDGSWTAVDASRGVSTIEPIYLRFPEDPVAQSLLGNSVHQMTINITKVEPIL